MASYLLKSNKPIIGLAKRDALMDEELLDAASVDDDELLPLIDKELLGTSEIQEASSEDEDAVRNDIKLGGSGRMMS